MISVQPVKELLALDYNKGNPNFENIYRRNYSFLKYLQDFCAIKKIMQAHIQILHYLTNYCGLSSATLLSNFACFSELNNILQVVHCPACFGCFSKSLAHLC
jgi:hypothetical protein